MFIRKISLLIFLLFSFSCVHVPLPEGGEEAVIVIHGFARRANSMNRLATKIHKAGYEVKNVDYVSLNQSIIDIKKDVFRKFDQYVSENRSKKIHFVGHSLGGLLIRSYLQENKINRLGSVVLMGTPNRGVRLVNEHQNKWYFSLLGSVVSELGEGTSDFLKTLKAPYYRVGVIAGSKPYTRLVNHLKGPNDGLVTVESAKLDEMHDFIVIDVNHSDMKKDSRVIHQVIHFLKHSQFKKD